jgi:alginate O-acetyltransferase complex protein AlgI
VTFTSLFYLLVFLPITLALYYVFRTRVTLANLVILVASYYFYGSNGVWLLIPLMVTSLIDFWAGAALANSTSPSTRKLLLWVSLTANLGLLAFFKYTPWLIAEINAALAAGGLSFVLPALAVTLPPGISFYTFQTMSYTIEVYRREMKPARSVIDYMAFVTFWPHLVAGPIMRAHNLLRQLEQVRPVVSVEDARYALMLISWGLCKKLVLADNFGVIVDSIDQQMKSGSVWSGAGLLFAYAFAGQIYCDFSAYTDIARGSAKLIGVDLVRNFLTPYFASSPSDFWRRWHISLSTWLRDYLYIPLGGNRFGRLKEYRNLMVTMALGGLWHGAGILFVLWGVWHGLLLVFFRLFPIDQHLTNRFGSLGKWISVLITFHLVCIGWIFFRADPTTIRPIFRSIGSIFSPVANDWTLFRIFGTGVLSLAAITLLTDYLGYRREQEFSDLFKKLNPLLCSILAVAFYCAITLLAKREGAQFIYFQF